MKIPPRSSQKGNKENVEQTIVEDRDKRDLLDVSEGMQPVKSVWKTVWRYLQELKNHHTVGMSFPRNTACRLP